MYSAVIWDLMVLCKLYFDYPVKFGYNLICRFALPSSKIVFPCESYRYMIICYSNHNMSLFGYKLKVASLSLFSRMSPCWKSLHLKCSFALHALLRPLCLTVFLLHSSWYVIPIWNIRSLSSYMNLVVVNHLSVMLWKTYSRMLHTGLILSFLRLNTGGLFRVPNS